MSEQTGKFLADVIRWLHFLWAGLVIVSLPAVIVLPWLRPYVAMAVVAMLVVWATTRDCPFRVIEHKLRLRFHPEGAHGEGFMYHHFGRPLGLSRRVTLWTNIGYALLVVIVCFL
jgi:hypothetical protein